MQQQFDHFETRATHAGHNPDAASGAVAPPIVLSTTFVREPDGTFPRGYIYTRENNPNREALENHLAQLEGGVGAITFSSGQAAAMSIIHTLSPGDHIIAPSEMYYGVRKIIRSLYGRWGVSADFVDMRDIINVKKAFRPQTRLVWMETPSNPGLHITDIRTVAMLAREHNALSVCDNTWSPLIQRPLELGCDMVIHSSTKYFGGHSDVLGGVVICRDNNGVFEQIHEMQTVGGAVPSPFDCWLLLRSLSSLPHRLRAQYTSAAVLANALQGHRALEAVHYPGLSIHPHHDIARQQMNRFGDGYFGGMLSIQIRGGAAEAMAVAAKVQLFTRATSLGGVESLIEHRASVEGPDTPTPSNLLRLSIGLEHPDDLLADLQQALA